MLSPVAGSRIDSQIWTGSGRKMTFGRFSADVSIRRKVDLPEPILPSILIRKTRPEMAKPSSGMRGAIESRAFDIIYTN